MKCLTREQPRHGLQPDVGMWRDPEALMLAERRRTHVVDEAPRPDGSSPAPWQRPADAERSDLTLAARSHLDTGDVAGAGLGFNLDVRRGHRAAHGIPPGRIKDSAAR